jgi:hypothetical protein
MVKDTVSVQVDHMMMPLHGQRQHQLINQKPYSILHFLLYKAINASFRVCTCPHKCILESLHVSASPMIYNEKLWSPTNMVLASYNG